MIHVGVGVEVVIACNGASWCWGGGGGKVLLWL